MQTKFSIWIEWADENCDWSCIWRLSVETWPDGKGGERIDQIKKSDYIKSKQSQIAEGICKCMECANCWPNGLPTMPYDVPILCSGRQSSGGQLYQAEVLRILVFRLTRFLCFISPWWWQQVCGLKARDFVQTFGDAHLYSIILEQSFIYS